MNFEDQLLTEKEPELMVLQTILLWPSRGSKNPVQFYELRLL